MNPRTMKPHVSLNVTDVDASVAFYEKAFGLPASRSHNPTWGVGL